MTKYITTKKRTTKILHLGHVLQRQNTIQNENNLYDKENLYDFFFGNATLTKYSAYKNKKTSYKIYMEE